MQELCQSKTTFIRALQRLAVKLGRSQEKGNNPHMTFPLLFLSSRVFETGKGIMTRERGTQNGESSGLRTNQK